MYKTQMKLMGNHLLLCTVFILITCLNEINFPNGQSLEKPQASKETSFVIS